MGRVWREGQKKDVFIYRLLTTGAGGGSSTASHSSQLPPTGREQAPGVPAKVRRLRPPHPFPPRRRCALRRQHRGEDLPAPAGQGGAVPRGGGRQRRRAAHLLTVSRGGGGGGAAHVQPVQPQSTLLQGRACERRTGGVQKCAGPRVQESSMFTHCVLLCAATSSRRCFEWTQRCSATRTTPSSAREPSLQGLGCAY